MGCWCSNQTQAQVPPGRAAQTFRAQSAWCWNVQPVIEPTGEVFDEVQLDGIYVQHGHCCSIAYANGYVVDFQWYTSEKAAAWGALLARIAVPAIVVIDGEACQSGYPVLFETAAGWVTRLWQAHQHHGGLDKELKRLRRYKLLIIDELGSILFDADAANLFFQLVASRYEQGSLLLTSNLAFSRWGEIFTDDVVAAAMIDHLVHHAEVISLDGDSYRTRARRELLDTTTTNQE